MYDALLLDHDGVLVDVLGKQVRLERFRTEAGDDLRALGFDPLEAEVLETLSSGLTYEQAVELASGCGADPDRLWRCRDDALDTVFRSTVTSGGKSLYEDVRALSELDTPLGIVSNNQARVVEFLVRHHGLSDSFDVVRAREPRLDSLRKKKPSPAYIREATDELGVENPLYVGDSETDVIAGERAGVDVAFIRRDHNAGVVLDSEPAYEVTSLYEVVGLYEGRR